MALSDGALARPPLVSRPVTGVISPRLSTTRMFVFGDFVCFLESSSFVVLIKLRFARLIRLWTRVGEIVCSLRPTIAPYESLVFYWYAVSWDARKLPAARVILSTSMSGSILFSISRISADRYEFLLPFYDSLTSAYYFLRYLCFYSMTYLGTS